MSRPRFSVVVPTYDRRDVLLGTLRALAGTVRPWPVELIVVVDGSQDGSAEAVEALDLPFPVRVIRQQNAGAAAARNRGAAAAQGELVLFLDDDMLADAQLLVEHEKLYAAGADAVIGDIPLDPGSPRNLLSIGVDEWATARRERLAGAGGELSIDDLLTGQLSVRTDLFREVGGFDDAFTTDGQFGGEDTDLGYRLLARGASIRYTPAAVSYQRYVITPDQHLRQWGQAGRADAMLTLKHPAMADELAQRCGGRRRATQVALLRRVVPATIRRWLVAGVAGRAVRGRTDAPTRWLYSRIREAHYWSGRYQAGGRPGARIPLQVLAYHGVDDDAAGPTDRYAVTAGRLEEHLSGLIRQGFTFVDADTFLGHLQGAPVRRPSLLLTFDDGYQGLLEHAAPIVARLGVPAVVFVVGGQLGGWNEWDAPQQEGGVPLLSVEELRGLRQQGWRIESHTQHHRHLMRASQTDLRDELRHPRRVLAAHGLSDRNLGQPMMLAYPYGEHSRRVRKAAERAGYRAAFALQTSSGQAARRSQFALPRVEVQHDTSFGELLAMIMQPPTVPGRDLLVRELRAVLSRFAQRFRARRIEPGIEPSGLRPIEPAPCGTENLPRQLSRRIQQTIGEP